MFSGPKIPFEKWQGRLSNNHLAIAVTPRTVRFNATLLYSF